MAALSQPELKVVTPDWVSAGVSAGHKVEEGLYHPRLVRPTLFNFLIFFFNDGSPLQNGRLSTVLGIEVIFPVLYLSIELNTLLYSSTEKMETTLTLLEYSLFSVLYYTYIIK